jgi:pyruvate dehydrogenase E2 component (dihydrolipoamide acetyltransferase)
MEVPAGVAGTVESLLVAVGDAVQEGQPIAMIASADDGAEPAAGDDDQPADGPDEEPDEEPADESADESDDEARPAARAPSSKQAKAPSRGEDDAEATGDDGADDSEVSVFVPSIGDAKDVVVIEVGVKAGDTVGPDDLIVVVESDKASMEIPAESSRRGPRRGRRGQRGCRGGHARRCRRDEHARRQYHHHSGTFVCDDSRARAQTAAGARHDG